MSSESAIIASNINVLKEVLDDDINCIMCQYDSLKDWTNAIDELIDNSKFRLLLAKNAKQKFLKKYTWQARASSIINEIS